MGDEQRFKTQLDICLQFIQKLELLVQINSTLGKI